MVLTPASVGGSGKLVEVEESVLVKLFVPASRLLRISALVLAAVWLTVSVARIIVAGHVTVALGVWMVVESVRAVVEVDSGVWPYAADG